MKEPEEGAVRGFAIRWVLLSALGLAAGLALGLASAGPIEALVGMMLVTPIILALAGSVFGASQWLAIWKWHPAGALWIAASAVGLGIGMTLGIVLVEVVGRAITGEQVRLFTISPLGRVLGLGVVGTVAGLAIGAAQHVALRPYRTGPKLWVLRCVVAFGLGLPGGGLAADLLLGGLQSGAGFATFLTTTGVIVAVLTVGAAKRLAPGRPVQRAA